MKNSNNIFKTFAVILVVFVCVYIVIALSVEINAQRDAIEKLSVELAEQKEKVAKLKYNLEQIEEGNPEYLIDLAREKLGYHLPGEIIFYNGNSK